MIYTGNRLLKLIAGGTAAALAIKALDPRISVCRYKIRTEKVSSRVRLALITDMHCKKRSNPHSSLMELIKQNRPDIVLLGGDIIENEVTPDTRITFLGKLGAAFPCYYVSGNHEYLTGSLSRTKKVVTSHGITVLDGISVSHTAGENTINICGVDDAAIGNERLTGQLHSARPEDDSVYSILLAHKPHLHPLYTQYGFDLILSGHTHGGQWRIPGLAEGVYAPGQGFFPPQAGGEYALDNSSRLIVSRGISSVSTVIPRVFNPPELVIVDICPKS